MSNTLMDNIPLQSESQPETIITPQLHAITPHSYPIFIKILGATSLIFFLFCIKNLPYYFEINTKMQSAYRALQKKDYFDAYVKYSELSSLFPKNKKLKICIAYALFTSPQEENHIMALNHLKSIDLDTAQWEDLQKYMPQQYISMFELTNKKVTS